MNTPRETKHRLAAIKLLIRAGALRDRIGSAWSRGQLGPWTESGWREFSPGR